MKYLLLALLLAFGLSLCGCDGEYASYQDKRPRHRERRHDDRHDRRGDRDDHRHR